MTHTVSGDIDRAVAILYEVQAQRDAYAAVLSNIANLSPGDADMAISAARRALAPEPEKERLDPDQFKREYMGEFPDPPKHCTECAMFQSELLDARAICDKCSDGDKWAPGKAKATNTQQGGDK